MKTKTKKTRFRKALPPGCLALIIIPVASTVASIWLTKPDADLPDERRLSWTRDLGAQPASREGPREVTVPPPIASFVLPDLLSVEDAIEWEDGWILLDRRSGEVHFFDPDSGVTRSMGGEGPGPGELQDPVALAVVDSSLWVVNQRGLWLDRFSVGKGFAARIRPRGGGCQVGLTKDLSILPGGRLFVLRVCPSLLVGPGTAFLEEVSHDGLLKPFVALPLGTPGSRKLHILRQPAVAAGRSQIFIGTWDTPCLAEIQQDGTASGHRCLPDVERPATREEDRAGLADRFRGITEIGFLPLEIPDHLPWYDRVFATSRGLVVRRIRGEEARDLVLLPPEEGSSVAREVFPENTYVGERTILAVRDLPNGTQVQVYPNPWHRER
ncbi:MAG: hypothetical protein HKO65_09685 [Gemmatimonadetes bacterium]|nr:hypothetical protein [Gemmatimonadota bacterium]NNM05363.1 hypothetical protein [Gemmatimonadota bacterium]